MNLDPRIIKDKKPLDCFETEEAKKYIGKECYFSDHLCTFNKLLDVYSYVTADMLVLKEKHLYVGELLTVGDSDESCYEAGINGEAEWFQFCLPCEWVKESEEPEKKYRPYSLNEFLNEHEIGDKITYRHKYKEQPENFIRHKEMICGYQIVTGKADVPGEGLINLGGMWVSLQSMFDDCETPNIYLYPEVWEPFGVKENE